MDITAHCPFLNKIQGKNLFGNTFFALHFLIKVVLWAEQCSLTINTSWISFYFSVPLLLILHESHFIWCIPQNSFFLKTRKLDLYLFYFQGAKCLYFISALLQIHHTYIYENSKSAFFAIDPPALEEYLVALGDIDWLPYIIW